MKKFAVGLIRNSGDFVSVVCVQAQTRKHAINAAIEEEFGQELAAKFNVQVAFVEIVTAEIERAIIQGFYDAVIDYQSRYAEWERAPIGDEYHRARRSIARDSMYAIHDLAVVIVPNANFSL